MQQNENAESKESLLQFEPEMENSNTIVAQEEAIRTKLRK